MEEKFYTIDKIAEMLGMHHKTIRKFINEGKLRANKVGKQWRISSHDLSLFMEDNNVSVKSKNESENTAIEITMGDIDSKISKINISTVIDIMDVDNEGYRRISNTLLALMNSRDSKMNNSNLNLKYYEKERNLKILLWGDLEFSKEMLDFISIFTKDNN
ncbi:helix-turn-helix domain-containing protein [Clostridium paraputrificum]|uniref:helix-turn-helix domain-containing protein n=1 Tax=Clostridium paraputrificum TaxID=29363 RepID=UPI000DD094D1|nr:helix-turn-helix domain-containing protein [Clostridium paraputrificum]MDB2118303.1 helix-turn-helix domain-containing protein [Clostridium paraputrificum]MDU4790039.1 helix-turn-helix domain-containing protein [Clostridium sp.]MDU6809420.1 helix-turn-helix domain-containing protein [Clostridium sp.]